MPPRHTAPPSPPSHPRHRRPAALLQEGGRTPTQIMASRQMYALAQSSTEMGSFIRPHCKSPFIVFVCLSHSHGFCLSAGAAEKHGSNGITVLRNNQMFYFAFFFKKYIFFMCSFIAQGQVSHKFNKNVCQSLSFL